MTAKEVREEEGKTIGRKRANEKIRSYLHPSQLETYTDSSDQRTGILGRSMRFQSVYFLGGGRREAGGEILQEGRVLFSPLGRNQEYFYFSVYSTSPFFFNEKFSFLFLALSRSASMALKSHTSSGDANSPLCPVLTQLLNKIPALAVSLWKQKYRNKIS